MSAVNLHCLLTYEHSQHNCVILHNFYITDSFFLNFANVLAITFSLCPHFNSIDETLSIHVFHVVTKYFLVNNFFISKPSYIFKNQAI